MFDLSTLFQLGSAAGGAGGWGAGTVIKPEGAFFSRDLSGGIAGIAPGGQKAIGQGLQQFATAMPGGFNPTPSQAPEAAGAGGFQKMLGGAMQQAGKGMSTGQTQTHPTGPGAFVNPDMVDPNFQTAQAFMEANARRRAMMGGQR